MRRWSPLTRIRRPIFVGAALLAMAAAASGVLTEYQVKAAFLLNFTRFVDWPPGEFPAPDAPLRICVIGGDPFGTALDRLVAGETAAGHRIQVERVSRRPSVPCQVVFVSREEREVRPILVSLGPGVLTVSEGDGFLRDGGMVAFVVENRRVRFDINQGAADRAGLKISSKLLNVARSVER